MNTLIKNGYIMDIKNKRWIEGNLLIKDEKIDKIGEFQIDKREVDEVINAKNMAIIPGLINGHSHSYTGLLKGTIEGIPLDIYMLYAIAGGSFRSPEEIYLSTMVDAIQMLKSGTTATIDHFSQRPKQVIEGIEAAIKAYREIGMRANIAPMYSDKSFFDTIPMEAGEFPDDLRPESKGKHQTPEEYGEIVEEVIRKWHEKDGIIRIMLGTDGPQRCSKKILEITKELEEKYEVGWHTHILEAKTQGIMAHKLYNMGLIEYIDSLGLINERTSFVHYIWVSDKEMKITKDRGANVIHCPSSNLHLGSGISPIDVIRSMGINVAIGSDGGNCGNLSMFEKIRLTANLHNVSQPNYHKWLSPWDVLEMNISGGVKAMLIDDITGSIEVGKEADIVLINLENSLWQPLNNLTNGLVYYENGSNVDTVFVKGKKVLEKGKVLFVDEDEIFNRGKEAVMRLKRDNREAFDLVKKQIPYINKMYEREMKKDIGFNRIIRPL